MAPRRKNGATATAAADEEDRGELERKRLRRQAEGAIVRKTAPVFTNGTTGIPLGLARCNGSDIMKKNTSRRKRYLMLFPGGFRLESGMRVGMLHGLSTRSPRLVVDVVGKGRLQFSGLLMFPKNALLALKASARRVVQVADTFDAVVVFVEWAWIGTQLANPGQLPEPLPADLRDDEGVLSEIWNKHLSAAPARAERPATVASSPRTRDCDAHVDSDDDEQDALHMFERGMNDVEQVVDLDDDDNDDDDEGEGEGEGGWDAGSSPVGAATGASGRRANPVRTRRRVVDYSQQMEDEDEKLEGGDGGDSGDAVEVIESESEDEVQLVESGAVV